MVVTGLIAPRRTLGRCARDRVGLFRNRGELVLFLEFFDGDFPRLTRVRRGTIGLEFAHPAGYPAGFQ